MPAQANLQDYRVELEAFSGPMDLLLFLVKRDEIDLFDIPIAKLTDQYLAAIKDVHTLDMDLTGEFLVMAATLLEIKSRLILPAQDREAAEAVAEQDEMGGLDPRYELVQQLLEYKRFKDAAMALDRRSEDWVSRYPSRPARRQPKEEGEAEAIEIDLEDVDILQLAEAYNRVMESIGAGPRDHQVVYDDTPIALHAEDILDRLRRDGAMTLQEMFQGRQNRPELAGLFLATLELVKQRRVRVRQEGGLGSPVALELVSEDEQARIKSQEDQPVDWRDPVTGKMQYEWSTEAAQRAAERRANLRAKFAALKAAEDAKDAASDEDGKEQDAGDEG